MNRSKIKTQEQEKTELATYFAKFTAAVTRIEEELARWKAYEDDYEALKTTLLDLPKEISHAVMVRRGKMICVLFDRASVCGSLYPY